MVDGRMLLVAGHMILCFSTKKMPNIFYGCILYSKVVVVFLYGL